MRIKAILLGVLAAMLVPLGGCSQRTLFKDTDLATDRKVGYYGSYDAESAKATADRRKHQNGDWGLGPNLFGGGD